MRAKVPQPQSQLPVGGPRSGKQLGTYALDTAMEKLLGHKLTMVEDTITRRFSQLLARERSSVVSETEHTATTCNMKRIARGWIGNLFPGQSCINSQLYRL